MNLRAFARKQEAVPKIGAPYSMMTKKMFNSKFFSLVMHADLLLFVVPVVLGSKKGYFGVGVVKLQFNHGSGKKKS